EEPGLRRREQRLSRRDRAGVAGGDGAEGVEIEGVADILEPPEPERRERRSRVETARCRISIDCIHGEMAGVGQQPRRGLDALQVLYQRRAADLDLYPVIAQIPEASDFFAETAYVVRGIVVPATSIDSDPLRRRLASKAIGQVLVKRQASDLRRGVPQRHV